MIRLFFLRHFKTRVDENKPPREWELDSEGKESNYQLLESKKLDHIHKVFSSPESKALITAKGISRKNSIPMIITKEIAEVDRSKTGYVKGNYKKVVQAYLTQTEHFNYKWESMVSVTNRIKIFLECTKSESGNLLIVSHGLFMSICLADYFGKNSYDFWKDLKFGAMLKVDFIKLYKIWVA